MRGNADFTVMKGFLGDLSIKGDTGAETLPPDPGKDVTDEEKLDNKAKGKDAPKGKHSTDEDDMTFDKDLSTVEEGAKRDEKDGYVSDVQGEKVSSAKGYDAYNLLVAKGMAVDVDMNPYNIKESLSMIEKSADMIMEKGGGARAFGDTKEGAEEWKKQAEAAKSTNSNPKKTFNQPKAVSPEPTGLEALKARGRRALDKGKELLNRAGLATGNKTENTLRNLQRVVTPMGKSEGAGKLAEVANVIGRNRTGAGKKILAGLAGAGTLAAGAGTYAATRKKKEEE